MKKPLYKLYGECAVTATKSLLKSWMILPASIVLYLIYGVTLTLFAPMGFGGGFVIGFVEIALLSLYYGWLSEALTRQGLSTKNIFDYDYQLFFHVISVAFIIFIAKFLVSGFAQSSPDFSPLPYFLQLGIFILFNALPEVLYIKRYESMEALQYSLYFTKTYWIEWFLPLILLLAPALYLSAKGMVTSFALSNEFLPILTVVQGWQFFGGMQGIAFTAIGLILGTWFMLFRAKLFEQLD